jgi:hypothetical protein
MREVSPPLQFPRLGKIGEACAEDKIAGLVKARIEELGEYARNYSRHFVPLMRDMAEKTFIEMLYSRGY